jgi:hypothetical protein
MRAEMSKDFNDIITQKLFMADNIDILDLLAYEKRADIYLEVIKLKKEARKITLFEHQSFLKMAISDYKYASTYYEILADNSGTQIIPKEESELNRKISESERELEELVKSPEYFFQNLVQDINAVHKEVNSFVVKKHVGVLSDKNFFIMTGSTDRRNKPDTISLEVFSSSIDR